MRFDLDAQKILASVLGITVALTLSSRLWKPSASLPRGGVQALEAKEKKRFWITSTDGVEGRELDGLANFTSFQRLFPGYPDEMRTDAELWSEYFKESFVQSIPFEWFTKDVRADYVMMADYRGCLPVVKKYGADILFFGNSEVFRAIVPDLLARRFPGKRILVCGGDLGFDGLVESVQALKKVLKEQEVTSVLGFAIDAPVHDFQKALAAKHRKRSWSWDAILPAASAEWFSNAETFSLKEAENFAYVEARAKRFESNCGHLKGLPTEACKLSGFRGPLSKLVRSLESFSKKVILYYPATTPLHFNGGPLCLDSAVRQLVESMRSATTLPVTHSWKEYGLKFGHFVSKKGSRFQLDENHPNHIGAKIITDALADRMGGRK